MAIPRYLVATNCIHDDMVMFNLVASSNGNEGTGGIIGHMNKMGLH